MSLTIGLKVGSAVVLGADSISITYERVGAKRKKAIAVENNNTKIHQIASNMAITNVGKRSPFLLKGGEETTIDSLLEDFSNEVNGDGIETIRAKWKKFLEERSDIEAEKDRLETKLREAIEKDNCKVVEVKRIESPSEGISVEYLRDDGTKGICSEEINDATLMLAGHRKRRITHSRIPYIETFPNSVLHRYFFKFFSTDELYASGCTHIVGAIVDHSKGYISYPFYDLHNEPKKSNAPEFLQLHRKPLGKLDSLGRRIRKLTIDEASELVADLITATVLYENIPGAKLNSDSEYDVPRVSGPADIAVIQRDRGFWWHTRKGVKQ